MEPKELKDFGKEVKNEQIYDDILCCGKLGTGISEGQECSFPKKRKSARGDKGMEGGQGSSQCTGEGHWSRKSCHIHGQNL